MRKQQIKNNPYVHYQILPSKVQQIGVQQTKQQPISSPMGLLLQIVSYIYRKPDSHFDLAMRSQVGLILPMFTCLKWDVGFLST